MSKKIGALLRLFMVPTSTIIQKNKMALGGVDRELVFLSASRQVRYFLKKIAAIDLTNNRQLLFAVY